MSDEIKFIVKELNSAPYNRNYNLITFDGLEPEQLLQVLNDVFTEIDPKNKMDIREEDPESMVVRMVGTLRMLQYRPPDSGMQDFKTGLVIGDKHVIQPILAWLLQSPADHKKRAYLARFLAKLEVPPEFLGDADISEVYSKYEEMVEQFKEIHREHDSLTHSGYSTAELRKDLAAMEEEREMLTRRISKSKQRVQSTPGYEQALESARNLRVQKEKQKEIAEQKSVLSSANDAAQQRIKRLETQINDLRRASVGNTADAILRRLEEDVNVNKYVVSEKLPKDLKSLEQHVLTLTKIVQMPAMGQQDIENINKKVGKLSFFRQNAAMISRRKQQTAERLGELRNELQHVQDDLKEKQDQLREFSGEEVLKGDDFKRYINTLRTKSSMYKMKRAELNDLRAEFGILSRTQDILKAKEAQLNQQMSSMEAEQGITGFRHTTETMEAVSSQKANLDSQKGETLEDMSQMVMELNRKIGERKSRLAPIIKELRPLRQHLQELTADHTDKKQSYDSVAAGLDSTVGKLERDVKSLYEEIIKSESSYHETVAQKEILSYRIAQAEEEIKLYLSNDPQDKKKARREQLVALIADQEKLGRQLRDDQKNVKDQVANSGKQLTMWQDVIRLMEVKRRCLESSRNTENEVMRQSGSEALVLN